MSWGDLDAVFGGAAGDAGGFREQFDEEEWAWLRARPAVLAAYREAFALRRDREAGRVPSHYTARVTCQRCGRVPIWPDPGRPEGARVLGCPWCHTGGAPA